jgi:hypothetical protein
VPAPPGVETPTGKVIDWAARLDAHAQSVDQRLKIPRWMEEVEKLGGTLVIEDAGVDDLEQYAEANDLVIVAAGKGQIVRLFERNAERSPYDQPMRALALTYVTGMTPRPEFSAVAFNLIPTVGEYFVFPALTTTGPMRDHGLRGDPRRPDGLLGRRDDTRRAPREVEMDPRHVHAVGRASAAATASSPTPTASSPGGFPPTVRKPVAELPSGRLVLGLADTIMLNDPITGQGSNNARRWRPRISLRSTGTATPHTTAPSWRVRSRTSGTATGST